MSSQALCRTASFGALLLAALGATPAFAQTATPAASSTDAATEEIVVTAQKREQALNDVGMTITAFNAQTLANQGVNDVTQLVRIVPGLSFFTTTTATPVYSLRGVGFNESSLAAYPAISIYQDEIPLPFPAMAAQAGLDPQRVEILRGPQGTLFGQNSTAGAINYVTARPTESFDAAADISASSFDTYEVNGHISGPLSDTLRARLSIDSLHGGPWQKSYVSGDTLGERDRDAARLLVDWDASARLHVSFNLNGWLDRSEPTAAQLVGITPGTPAAVDPDLLTYPLLPRNDDRLADWSSAWGNRAHDTFWQAAARADYDFVNGMRFTSITSYADYERDQRADLDGTALSITDSAVQGHIQSFFEELRLSNSGTERLRWIAGLNYGHDKVYDNDLFGFVDASGGRAFGFGYAGFFSDQEMSNYAAFGNVEYDLTRDLTFKVGARYTRADRDLNGMCSYDTGDGGAAAAFTYIAQLFDPTAPAIAPGQCFTLNPATFRAGLFTSQLNEDNTSWRLGLDYHLTQNTLLYFNIAQGYKAGGFPTVQASFTSQYVPVTQESVLDYEAGIKTTLWDGRLSFDAAAFYYDYSDKQVRAKVLDPIFGPLEALQNIPRSEVSGFEFALAARPVDHLTLGLSATYLDAKITEFTGVNAAGILADFSGAPMPYTPKWQIVANADYEWPVMNNISAFVGGNVTYHSSTYAGIGTDSIPGGTGTDLNLAISGYTTLDLRAGFSSDNDRWRLTFWGHNVTDEYYWVNTVRLNDVVVRYPGMPATYGVTLSLKY
ncbi:MAG TPA: TonB-dependent receptor [Vitreimonas sp.]|nr:TonB-dependent receptor [Vitreimonas sp.]